MPCRDDYAAAEYAADQTRKIDRLAEMLCGLCTRVEAVDSDLIQEDKKLAKWWETHKRRDAEHKARVAEEKRVKKLKRAALAKLSDEEVAALGLAPKVGRGSGR